MNILNNIQAVYFIGIGGIGMSALARFVSVKGIAVYGYDKTQSSLTDALVEEGMSVSFKDEVELLPQAVLHKQNTLIIYTPAIPKDSKLLQWFAKEGYPMLKRSQFLGEVTKDTLCLAVAGTHGKTTTSAILAHLLVTCDMPVTAFLGGIAENYHSNFISKGTKISVVEADEFDRSFLNLHPDIACVTSMDADHLDIYGDASQLEQSFKDFAALVAHKDKLFYKKGLLLQGISVAINEEAKVMAHNVRIKNGGYVFDLKTPLVSFENLELYLPGHHNLHNAITALAMALLADAPVEKLHKALASFKGVKRRFSYKINTERLVLIDDYAHHPTEINALFQAVTEMYPEEANSVVFQPHLFSRTRDFAAGFAESLAQFDEVFLLDIYPAREMPIEGITAHWLLEKITALNTKAALISKADIAEKLKHSKGRIKVIAGAGDIGVEVATVTKALSL